MRKFSLVIKILTFLSFTVFICLFGLYIFAYVSPKIELKTANQFLIYDGDDQLVFQGSGTSEWVNIDSISPDFIDAVISVEDKSFYIHKGFDYLRIAKALFTNAQSGEIVSGASTISQQYVKNMYLTFEQSWMRKIEEAFLTMRLESHYKKEEILEGYLNTINFGNGNYGVQNASRYYFNKNADELSLEEAVMLAGIPKNPGNYNPISNIDAAINRGKIVAKAMIANNKLTDEEFNELFKEDIEIYGIKDKKNLQTLMYYQDAVIAELKAIANIPTSLLSSGGLKIYTNLDMEAQTNMENAIIEQMAGKDLEVSSIMINPTTGKIIALTGGYNYSVSQYNRATQSVRQVGSSIKPFLYYAALENGFVSSSTLLSKPTTFTFANNNTYSPSNYNDIYGNKEITMAAAIAYSDNIYAVKTHLFLGEEMLVKTAERMGLEKKLMAIPSLPLGTDELNLIDYATAYNTLASGGFKRDLFFIRKVEDINGNVLYEHNNKTDLVLNQNYTFILNEMLTSSYNAAFIDYNSPTVMSITNQATNKYAVKTGSTGTDFWMVGYNPDVLMVVWNGKDDSSTLKTSDNLLSKRIWIQTVEKYLENKETKWYETPENVVGDIQDPITGEYTSNSKKATVFYYLKGTEPNVTASVSKEQKK